MIEIRLVLGKVSDPRHVDGDDADGAGALTGAEKSAGFFAQLAKVEPQAAAHAADIRGLHIAVDIVGEIRRAVFRGHLKEQLVVFGFRPVKVPRDGVGRDRVLEAASVGVALDHRFDEGAVDHIHFRFAVLVFERHFFPAYDGVLFGKIRGNGPVERDVGEGCLRSPAARRIDAEDEGFDALFYFAIGKVIRLDKRSKVGIEGGKRLCARPFVLHDAEKIDHLIAERREMACRR